MVLVLIFEIVQYIKAWQMLCDLYINHFKESEPQLVEACFKHMLKLDPRSFHSQHNLCIFYIDSKRKNDAAECIVAAKRFATMGFGYAPEHAAVLDMRFNKELN